MLRNMSAALPIVILATLAIVIIAGGLILIFQATLASVKSLLHRIRFLYKWSGQPKDCLVSRHTALINQRLPAIGSFSDIRKEAVSCILDIADKEKDRENVPDKASEWVYGTAAPRVYRYLWHYVLKLFEQQKARREKESDEKALAHRRRQEELRKEEEFNCRKREELARNQEEEDRKWAQAHSAARRQEEETVNQSILHKHQELIAKFREITYRKVSRLDDYGDETWDALPTEIEKCLTKIEHREDRTLSRSFFKTKLEEMYREYHSSQKSRLINKTEFNDLSGVQFETWVADKLKANGFLDVRGTATTGDQGADIIAKVNNESVVIQVKRYQGAVGNSAVQQVIAARHYYRATHAWVITNSNFTNSARELAQKGGVQLIDGQALTRIDSFLAEWIKLNSFK